MWGYVEAHVYADEPTSIGSLEDNIEKIIREIPTVRLEKVCQNWTKQMNHLSRSLCQHFARNNLQTIKDIDRNLSLNKYFIILFLFYCKISYSY